MFTTFLLLACQDEAVQLFRRFERRISEAPSVSLGFRGERREGGEASSYSGTLRIRGGKYVIRVAHNVFGVDRMESLRCNGKETVLVTGSQWREMKTTEDVPRLHLASITRTGFFVPSGLLKSLLEGTKAPGLGELFPATDLNLAVEGKIHRLEYKVEDWSIQLWLDDSLTPLRRRATSGDVVVLETYSEFSTEAVPEETFERD